MNTAEKFKSSKVTFRQVVKHFSTLEEAYLSDVHYVRGLPWQIKIQPYYDDGTKCTYWFRLYCADAEEWNMHTLSCDVRATMRIVSQKQGVPDFVQEIKSRFNVYNSSDFTFSNMQWNDVCDADKGYIKEDIVIFEATVIEVVPDVNEAKHGRYLEMVKEFKKVELIGRRGALYRRDRLFPFIVDPSGRKTSFDVKLIGQNKTFYCDRDILSGESPVFDELLTGAFAEASQTEILLDDDNISDNTMLDILRFIYCHDTATDLTQANLEIQYEFLYAGDKYDLKQLVDLVAFALEEGLDPSNACRCLLIADLFSLVSLKILCFAMMENPDNERAIHSSPEFAEVERNQELVKEFLVQVEILRSIIGMLVAVVAVGAVVAVVAVVKLKRARGDAVPKVYSCPGLKSRLLRDCLHLSKPYSPSAWLQIGAIQTILRVLVKLRLILDYKREIFVLSDGGEVALDWYREQSGKPLVLVLPGLTGSSSESYLTSMVLELFEANGFGSVVFNNRGCGGVELKTPKVYSAAYTDDFAEVVQHVKARFPDDPLYAVGFSMGGMILFNYLSKCGSRNLNPGIQGAMTISSPWNPFESTHSLEGSLFARFVFSRTLAMNLCAGFKRHLPVLKDKIDAEHVLQSRTITQFDTRVIVPLFNYADLKDYYTDAMLSHKVNDIPVPTLCLVAADDCFVPVHSIPLVNVQQSKNVAVVVTDFGGHVAFLSDETILPRGAGLAEKLACQFFRHLQEGDVMMDIL